MTQSEKRQLDEVLTSIVRGVFLPVIAGVAWLVMVVAYAGWDVPIDPLLMGGTLGLAGLGRALDVFKVTKR